MQWEWELNKFSINFYYLTKYLFYHSPDTSHQPIAVHTACKQTVSFLIFRSQKPRTFSFALATSFMWPNLQYDEPQNVLTLLSITNHTLFPLFEQTHTTRHVCSPVDRNLFRSVCHFISRPEIDTRIKSNSMNIFCNAICKGARRITANCSETLKAIKQKPKSFAAKRHFGRRPGTLLKMHKAQRNASSPLHKLVCQLLRFSM